MWDKIIYFNVAAVPVYSILWFTTAYRKMTKGRTNVLFLSLTVVAFLTVLFELGADLAMEHLPLSPALTLFAKIMEYGYFVFRNAVNAVYLFFLYSVTRTWYRIRPFWKKLLLATPYLMILGVFLTNESTHYAFTVTPEAGYVRGSHFLILYVLAAFYIVYGSVYLTVYRRTVTWGAMVALVAVYVMNILAIVFQFFYPQFLVECYFTSITLLFVVLFVQRPENQVDINTGLPSYQAFREEMKKIRITGQHVQVVIVSIRNAEEIRRFLGTEAYFAYVSTMNNAMKSYTEKENLSCEFFFEQPGCFYVIMEDTDFNPVQGVEEIRRSVRINRNYAADKGALADLKIVAVSYPEDMSSVHELFRLGHDLNRFANVDRIYERASQIVEQRAYQIQTHIGEILDRAVANQTLKIDLYPAWYVRKNAISSAEAVIRLDDEEFGQIDEVQLREAAEGMGLSRRLSEHILEQVFAYVGSDDFAQSPYRIIAVELSVTHAMQMNYLDFVWRLRERYEVHPEQICFAIKETVYENASTQLGENLRQLDRQGYRISLDGYGKGYSNMQHILEMPIHSVRMDPGMVAAASSEEGRALLRGTIQMLKSISLLVVARGADTPEAAWMLKAMGCDVIQGDGIMIFEKEEFAEGGM